VVALAVALDVAHACPECGRAFGTPRALGAHSRAHRHERRTPPATPSVVPGWRIEAGPPHWQWALSWRHRADGCHLDGVPGALRHDVVRRCWLAGIDTADPDAVLAVAVSLLSAKGIVVDAIEELDAGPVRRWRAPRRPPCPVCEARAIWPSAFAPGGPWADRRCPHAAPVGLVGVGRGAVKTRTETDLRTLVD